jgi:hypothetical protein
VSATTDANDRDTLEAVGRYPGTTRRSPFVNPPASARLIRAGLVAAPAADGKLYLTDAGRAELADGPACGIGECGCHAGTGTP